MRKRSNWLKNDREAEEAKRTMAMDAKMSAALEECEAKTNFDLRAGVLDKEEYELLINVIKELRDLMKLPHSYDSKDDGGDKVIKSLMDKAFKDASDLEEKKENEKIRLAEE